MGIAAAFRSPKPEIRSRAILDYGVVTGLQFCQWRECLYEAFDVH